MGAFGIKRVTPGDWPEEGWDASGKVKGPEMFVLKKTMLQEGPEQNPQFLPLPW